VKQVAAPEWKAHFAEPAFAFEEQFEVVAKKADNSRVERQVVPRALSDCACWAMADLQSRLTIGDLQTLQQGNQRLQALFGDYQSVLPGFVRTVRPGMIGRVNCDHRCWEIA
jgi:hypothetical protein